MKNFGTLYRYELKKLLKRKLAWIMVLVLAAFMAYTARPLGNSGGAHFSLTDRTGNTVSKYISVAEQRKLIDEGEQRINGQVMDEQFFQNVREASTGNSQYIIQENLEPVFIIENAGWTRDFPARQGKFSQEYWMYFKKM